MIVNNYISVFYFVFCLFVFQARISKVGVPDLETAASRQRRASSVQRQTDTLRRLAQMRDVTPR